MIDDAEVGRAAREALRELGMDGWRCEVGASMAAPDSATRQLRLSDPAGVEHNVAVSFQRAEGDYKAETVRQLRALNEVSGEQ